MQLGLGNLVRSHHCIIRCLKREVLSHTILVGDFVADELYI